MSIYYALAGWSGNRERRDERTKRKRGKEKARGTTYRDAARLSTIGTAQAIIRIKRLEHEVALKSLEHSIFTALRIRLRQGPTSWWPEFDIFVRKEPSAEMVQNFCEKNISQKRMEELKCENLCLKSAAEKDAMGL
ncbi:hypothetical protein EVAR_37718_1 [Eumeta japonica]|uniref:Uncharacterized protein n=1 Tax=Eumeta variegata TaxID=151549 RepID=A0A4C1YNY6_EUMVA|nr:hypothetical protein EVAR_37718_1 [Eumeta japonica]